MGMYSSLEGADVSSTTRAGLPNVSQYGWSSYEVEEYKQLIEYVDEAKKYAEEAKSYLEVATTLYEAILVVKSEVDQINADLKNTVIYVNSVKVQIEEWYSDIRRIHTDIQQLLVDTTNLRDEVLRILAEVQALHDNVVTMKAAIEISESNAAASAEASAGSATNSMKFAMQSEEYYDKCYELYLDLKQGQVYRGSWNPNSGVYPDFEGTNSVWDVVLNSGQLEVDFDGKKWYWGDRLFYSVSESSYFQIESGATVKSINGKTGAVILGAADVGAVAKTGDTMTGTLNLPSIKITGDGVGITNRLNANLIREGGNSLHTVVGNDSGNVYLDTKDGDANVRAGLAVYRIYHTGYKPTYTDVGAAPEGFGLGTWGRISSDANLIGTGNGFFAAGGDGSKNFANQYSPLLQFSRSGGADGTGQVVQVQEKEGTLYLRSRSMNNWTGWHKMYSTAQKPTASELEVVSRSGDTMTGALKINSGSATKPGLLVGSSSHKAAVGVSNVAGEVLFGAAKTGGDFSSYVRVGHDNQTFTFSPDATTQHKIYHEGNKPTPATIGAVSKAGDTMTGELIAPILRVQSNGYPGLVLTNTGASPDHRNRLFETAPNGTLSIITRKQDGTNNGVVTIPPGKSGEIYHTGFKPTYTDVGAADMTTNASEVLMLSNSNNARAKKVTMYSKEGRLYAMAADGTVSQFYNDRSYRPTLADFGGLGVENGNELNMPSNSANFYFGYRKTGAMEIATYHFMNNKSQQTGFADIKAKEIYLGDGTKRVYHQGFKPTATDVGAIAGLSKNNFLVSAPTNHWQILARVRMPQSASTSKFTIVGGTGFNTGLFPQATQSEIIIRSGNNNPKGITAVVYNIGGTSSLIKNVAWKLASGDDYDIYVQCDSYANAGIRVDWVGASSTLVSWGSGPATSDKPSGVTDGLVVRSYNTQYKPTASDVGALSLSGGTLTGNLAINNGSNNNRLTLGSGSSTTGLFRVDDNLYVSAYQPAGRVIIEGQANPSAKVGGNTYTIYHAGNKPSAGDVGTYTKAEIDDKVSSSISGSGTKTVTLNAPSGVVAGKYYPILVTGTSNNQTLYVSTRSSGGSDPMNNCSFDGIVRSGGWSDKGSYAFGVFRQYSTGERALHSILAPSEAEGAYAVYVEARAFPVTLKVSASCVVQTSASNISFGTSVFNAGVDAPAGTKVTTLSNFSKGNGVYDSNGKVYSESNKPSPADIGAASLTAENTFTNALNIEYDHAAPLTISRGSQCGIKFRHSGATSKYLGVTNGGDLTYGSNLDHSANSKVYHQGFKPTAADVGAVSKAGDTMTGTLTTTGIQINNTSTSAQGVFITAPTPSVHFMQGVGGANGYIGMDGSGKDALYVRTPVEAIRHKIYHQGFKPTASDIGALALTGGTVTGDLASNGSLRVGNTSHKAIMRTSGTTNEYIFGGRANDSAFDATDYVRIGVNKLQYHTGGNTNTIYHSGNKPTAADVGALPTNGKAASASTADTVGSTNLGRTYTSFYTIPNDSWWGDMGIGASQMVKQNSSGLPVAANGYAFKVAARDMTKGHAWLYMSNYEDGGSLYYGANASGTAAPKWSKVYSDRNKPTAADVGALPLAGGTLTGSVTLPSSASQLRCTASGTSDLNSWMSTAVGMFSYRANITKEGSTNMFPSGNNANGVLSFNTHQGEYNHQLGFSSNGNLYHRHRNAGTPTSWAKLYSERNKPSASDVGALPITGGTASDHIWVDKGPDAGPQMGVKRGSVSTHLFDNGAESGIYQYRDGTSNDTTLISRNHSSGTVFLGGGKTVSSIGPFVAQNDIGFDMTGGRRHLKFNTDGSPIHIFADKSVRNFQADAGFKITGGGANGVGVQCDFEPVGEPQAGFRTRAQPGAWTEWKSAAPALQVDCSNPSGAAYEIWRATQWGAQHIAAMQVHVPGGDFNNSAIAMSLGNGSTQYMFNANGTAYANGGWSVGSDRNFKEDIVYSDSHKNKMSDSFLDKVCQLRTANFKYKAGGDTRLGFIAQDVQPIIPEAVTEVVDTTKPEEERAGTERLYLDSMAIIAAQNEAIKELRSLVTSLTARVEQLEVK